MEYQHSAPRHPQEQCGDCWRASLPFNPPILPYPLCAAALPQLILPQEQYGGVLRQLRRDLDLLQRLHVIDYSLLLGVHFARW